MTSGTDLDVEAQHADDHSTVDSSEIRPASPSQCEDPRMWPGERVPACSDHVSLPSGFGL